MNKRGILFLTILLSINLVSALSIGEALDQIGGENILLIGIFLISFALLNMILGRFSLFKDEVTGRPTSTPPIIAFIISIFIIYGLYKMNFDLENILFNLGISSDLIYPILMIAIIIGAIYASYKLKDAWIWKNKCIILLFAGITCIWLSMTDLVYEQDTVLIIGIVLIIIWYFCKRSKTKDKPKVPSTPGVDEKDRDKQKDEEDAYRNPRKPRSPARFDVVIGGQQYTVGNGDKQTFAENFYKDKSAKLIVKNGGYGGILLWKAAATDGLKLSKNSGTLKAGKKDEIIISIEDMAKLDSLIAQGVSYPHITIMGKAGATDQTGTAFIRSAIGKLRVYFKKII
jgi:hypothetical protein